MKVYTLAIAIGLVTLSAFHFYRTVRVESPVIRVAEAQAAKSPEPESEPEKPIRGRCYLDSGFNLWSGYAIDAIGRSFTDNDTKETVTIEGQFTCIWFTK